MKFEFTKSEYRDLLDILHIADIIMSGHRREEDPRSERHRALIQKLYALARDEGFGQLIDYNENARKYVPTGDFEEGALAHTMVDEFADHLFWDELISRLSVRDAARHAGGLARLNAMSDDDRRAAEAPARERYIEEFSRYGLDNLAVVERLTIEGEERVKTSD